MSKNHRVATALAVTLLCLGLAACGQASGGPALSWQAAASPSASIASPPPTPSPTPSPTPEITYPTKGTGTYTIAKVAGPIAGTKGTLLRYRIAVEGGITGVDPDEFAVDVEDILSDPRSWTGTKKWRLQLAAAGTPYDFTIYLATPVTRDKLCISTYDRYTSCRRDDKVVLNVARWVHSVPNYGASLTAYREYMVNHETGHRLYNGHELCPGPGKLAPVMQQQTLGLHGCKPNSWPVVDGRAYHGRSGQYNDPVPKA